MATVDVGVYLKCVGDLRVGQRIRFRVGDHPEHVGSGTVVRVEAVGRPPDDGTIEERMAAQERMRYEITTMPLHPNDTMPPSTVVLAWNRDIGVIIQRDETGFKEPT